MKSKLRTVLEDCIWFVQKFARKVLEKNPAADPALATHLSLDTLRRYIAN